MSILKNRPLKPNLEAAKSYKKGRSKLELTEYLRDDVALDQNTNHRGPKSKDFDMTRRNISLINTAPIRPVLVKSALAKETTEILSQYNFPKFENRVIPTARSTSQKRPENPDQNHICLLKKNLGKATTSIRTNTNLLADHQRSKSNPSQYLPTDLSFVANGNYNELTKLRLHNSPDRKSEFLKKVYGNSRLKQLERKYQIKFPANFPALLLLPSEQMEDSATKNRYMNPTKALIIKYSNYSPVKNDSSPNKMLPPSRTTPPTNRLSPQRSQTSQGTKRTDNKKSENTFRARINFLTKKYSADVPLHQVENLNYSYVENLNNSYVEKMNSHQIFGRKASSPQERINSQQNRYPQADLQEKELGPVTVFDSFGFTPVQSLKTQPGLHSSMETTIPQGNLQAHEEQVTRANNGFR